MKTFIFNNGYSKIVLNVKKETKIQDLINQYFEKIQKGNLIEENFEKTYFIYNGESIYYKDNNETVESLFPSQLITINVLRLYYDNNFRNYKVTKTIKDNIYTCVDEAKVIFLENKEI